MDKLFSILFAVCFIGLIVGLISPRFVVRWGAESKRTRKNVLKYYGLGLLATSFLFSLTAPDTQVLMDANPVAISPAAAPQQKTPKEIATEQAAYERQQAELAAQKAAEEKMAAEKVAAEKAAVEAAEAKKAAADIADLIHMDLKKDASSIQSFADKYMGSNIELELITAFVEPHKNYKTRFNYVLYAVDGGKAMLSGPAFFFKDVNYSDLHLTGSNQPDTFGIGLHCRVNAEVRGYEDGFIILSPVSVEVIKAY